MGWCLEDFRDEVLFLSDSNKRPHQEKGISNKLPQWGGGRLKEGGVYKIILIFRGIY